MKKRTYTIPGTLAGMNEMLDARADNRYRAGRAKRREMGRIISMMTPSPRGDSLEGAAVIVLDWYCPDRRRDRDNVAAAKKHIFDALICAGLLAADSWKKIVGFMDRFHLAESPDSARIELTIYEAEDCEDLDSCWLQAQYEAEKIFAAGIDIVSVM